MVTTVLLVWQLYSRRGEALGAIAAARSQSTPSTQVAT
jgi:hypothetical protein